MCDAQSIHLLSSSLSLVEVNHPPSSGEEERGQRGTASSTRGPVTSGLGTDSNRGWFVPKAQALGTHTPAERASQTCLPSYAVSCVYHPVKGLHWGDMMAGNLVPETLSGGRTLPWDRRNHILSF